MIKDIKRSLKLVKYGIQFKQMVGMSIVFFVIGLAFLIFATSQRVMIGVLYMVMCLSYLCQPYYSLEISSCVKSSGFRKGMFLGVPVMLNGISGVVGYIISLAVMLVKLYCFGGDSLSEVSVAMSLILAGVLSMVLQIYMIIAYKKFIISLIVFMMMFFPLYFGANAFATRMNEINIPLPIACIGGFVCVLIGTALSYLAARLTYKAPLDDWYFKRSLANAMK